MLVTAGGQKILQRVKIVVGKRPTRCPRELGADEHAVVDERVVQDEVLGPHQMADGPDIRGMAADENGSILDAEEVGDATLELAVDRAFACDESARGDRRAVAVNGHLGGSVDVWMPVEPQIVVRPEIDQNPPIDVRCRAGSAIVNAEKRIGDT